MAGYEVYPECASNFASIKSSLQNVDKSLERFDRKLDGVTSELNEARRHLARQEENNRGLWKEIREDVMPELRSIPAAARDAIDRHAADCPARQKALRRARGERTPDSDPAIDTRRIRVGPHSEVARHSNGDVTMPRRLLYLAIGLGAAVAAAGWVWRLLDGILGA